MSFFNKYNETKTYVKEGSAGSFKYEGILGHRAPHITILLGFCWQNMQEYQRPNLNAINKCSYFLVCISDEKLCSPTHISDKANILTSANPA